MGWFFKKKEAQMPSIYNIILSALDENGRLPHDFSLPQKETPNGLRFASGAMDGIGVFHTAGQDANAQAAQLAALLERACKQYDAKIQGEIEAFLKENHVLHIVDPLIDLIREGKTRITPSNLRNVGFKLMTEENDAESVKLGIAMTGLVDIEKDTNCRKAILALGKCDEFTLYSLVAVSGWEDSNNLIFQLARETDGWGKIHAVERLEPRTEEIRDWIIQSGCKNDVLNSYLGLTCAEKGNLLSYLQRETLSNDFLRGAGIILSAMLDEGPTAGISVYDNAEQATREYLRHVEKSSSLAVLAVVLELGDWLEDCNLAVKTELLASCRQIASKEIWPPIILQSIVPGDNAALWQATFAAKHIGMDITEPLFGLMKSNPMEYSGYVHNICRLPEYAEKLFQLYEEALPLNEIASGMGDLLGFGPEFKAHGCLDMVLQELKSYPGQGIALIKAGLGAPVVRCRNLALNSLEAWTAQGQTLEDYDPELRPLLQQVWASEVNDTTKGKLDALLR